MPGSIKIAYHDSGEGQQGMIREGIKIKTGDSGSDPRQTKRPQHDGDHDRPHAVHPRDIHEVGDETDHDCKDKDYHAKRAGEEKRETHNKRDHNPVQHLAVNPVKAVRKAG